MQREIRRKGGGEGTLTAFFRARNSEIICSQDLDDAVIRQYSKFAGKAADVLLKLEGQIEAWPVMAQVDPG